ncbi:MAG: hypothetical protein MSG64_12900 [Pyrinomonadaceae bacterium MAG19_C2-C3]|nr:hypothetical protein [Pyrinomonadaceae bacterium MAG19_C2-C3]
MRCFSSTSHGSISLLLAFWLSGLACAIFCLPQTSAAAVNLQTTSLTVKRDDANKLNGSHENDSHACCRRFQKPSGATSTRLSLAAEQVPSSHSCCAWFGQTAVADATGFKLRAIDMQARVARIFSLPQVSSKQKAFAAIGQMWLPDGGGTYLRCCMFLI